MKTGIFKSILITFLLVWCNVSYAQDTTNTVIFHILSSHTSFPDTGRAKGYIYDKVLYTSAGHYQDSTVLIIAPKNLDTRKKADLVFWFHGWHNNVDNAAAYYALTKQFIASRRNAALILAETAKDSPDSYGGKLENPGVFKLLVTDVLNGLKGQHLIGNNCIAGNILLAGHSGAYRVMAHIVKNGQLPVKEVILFDALYAGTEKFTEWIKAGNTHRFIDIYTDHGGTDEETRTMMKLLTSEHIPYVQSEESNVTPKLLKDNRLVYIHTPHEHNNIINNPDNFRLFIENSPFLKKL